MEELDLIIERMEKAPNPQCYESVCNPNFWVPERGLCIYCGYRKQKIIIGETNNDTKEQYISTY